MGEGYLPGSEVYCVYSSEDVRSSGESSDTMILETIGSLGIEWKQIDNKVMLTVSSHPIDFLVGHTKDDCKIFDILFNDM